MLVIPQLLVKILALTGLQCLKTKRKHSDCHKFLISKIIKFYVVIFLLKVIILLHVDVFKYYKMSLDISCRYFF